MNILTNCLIEPQTGDIAEIVTPNGLVLNGYAILPVDKYVHLRRTIEIVCAGDSDDAEMLKRAMAKCWPNWEPQIGVFPDE